MAKQRQISEKAALRSKEEDLRRLAKWDEKSYSDSDTKEYTDWDKQDKAKIIDYLQCQFIVGTSMRPGWAW